LDWPKAFRATPLVIFSAAPAVALAIWANYNYNP
jgi:hypothetical protein